MSLLQMSLWGSAIILLTVFIRGCALNRLPKRAFVALWMLAAVRMLLPYTLPCPVSMQTMTRQALPARSAAPTIQAEPAIENHTVAAPSAFGMPAAQPVRQTKRVEIPVAKILYLAGAAACILIIGVPHLRWRRIYAQALPAQGERIRRWKQERGISRRVRVCVSDRIAAPLTTGLIRPRILLPAGAEAWSADRLTYVLEHEWTHIRRGDVARKGILAAALCAHWFNPLAWLMFILSSRDMELACDEAIIRRFGVDARAGYATTLIDLAAERPGRRDSLVSAFSFAGIEERIGSIMRMKKKSWLSALLAIVLVVSMAAVMGTTAEEKQDATAQKGSAGNAALVVSRYQWEGWDQMTLAEYHDALERMWRDNPESKDVLLSALQDESLNGNSEYGDFARYALYPVAVEWDKLTSEERNTCWIWADTLEWESENTSDPSWMEVDFEVNVPDAHGVTVGKFLEAMKDIRESMLDWPDGVKWDIGHSADWYNSASEWVQYNTDPSSRAGVLCDRWRSENLDVSITCIQESSEQRLLRQYLDLGLNYTFHGYPHEYALEMHYDGKLVHSVWDPQLGILIENSMNGFYLGDDAIDLTVEYENGQPSRLLIDDEGENHIGKHVQETSEKELLSLLQPDGWAGMTISEYQQLLWTERDTPEYMDALDTLSHDLEFYESRGSDANADYYFNIYEPLTASQWRTRSWDGAVRSVQDGHVRMEYTMSLTILDGDSLTVGEYDDARASVLAELDGILEKYAGQDEAALRASVKEDIEDLSRKYGGDALEISVEYILDVENAEQTETAAPDDQEPRTYAPATEEQYASLLQIMPEEQDTVADFNRALLAWCGEDYERMERVLGGRRDDIQAPLTEAERRFVQLTAGLSGVENGMQVQSIYTGQPLEDPVLEGGEFWKQSEDGLCWCNLWYQFSYHIADPETLTVGERDRHVEGMLSDIENFWNDSSLEELLSENYDVEGILSEIAEGYSDNQMTLKIDPERVFFEQYDNRNRG